MPSLYSYYLNAIEEYLDNGVATFYYPSQPIVVILKKDVSRKIKLTIDEDSLVVNEQVLMEALINNSQQFFDILLNQLKLKNYEHELAQIEAIKRCLLNKGHSN